MTTVAELKSAYRGDEPHTLLTEDQAAVLLDAMRAQPGVTETPPDELRYVEGLLSLPYGELTEFGVLIEGGARCGCGRTRTAMDMVAYAVENEVHDRSMMAAALVGPENLFEFADDGRAAACYDCGEEFISGTYYTHHYYYA